jgi:hydrogenase maturation protease
VVGLGQPFAGDDAVGVHVLAKLGEQPPTGADLVVVSDATAVIELLRGRQLAIVVDAWLGNRARGAVHVLDVDVLDTSALWRTSSHGTSLGQALALGRTLYPEDFAPEVRIVAVTIDRATPAAELSAEVALAVNEAAERVRALLDAKTLRIRSSS